MGNEVAAQRGTTGGLSIAVPAHIAAAMQAAGGGNIVEKTTVPSLHTGGKGVWKISVGGETKVLQRRDPESGEMENVQTVRVVILDAAKDRGRQFHDGPYDEANPRQPDCWSDDGKRPHVSVEAPQCGTCELCPKAAKGSVIENGREGVACKQYRLLAVVPANDLAFTPLRFKISVTSDWDKGDDEAMGQGWLAWRNYCDLLRANGVAWTNAVVTTLRFASTVYPKVQFKLHSFLEPGDFQTTLALAQSEGVQKLLKGFTPAGADGKPVQKGKPLPKEDDETPDGPAPTGPDPVFSKSGKAAEEALAAEQAKAKAAEEAKLAEQYAAMKAAEDAKAKAKAAKVAAAKAAAEAAAAAAAAAAKAAEEDDEGSGFDEAPAAPKAAAAAPAAESAAPKKAAKKEPPPAPPTAPAEVPPALSGILGDWE